METLLGLLLIFFLVLLNGFFVAAEFSLVAVRKTRMKELAKKGSTNALLVQKALGDLDTYISATQLGITLASLALGWVGEPTIAAFITPLFSHIPSPMATYTVHTVSVVIAFTFITILHIVLGELAPKSIALARSESTALMIIRPLLLFTRVFSPVIALLNRTGLFIVRLFGIDGNPSHHSIYSEEEIKMILNQSSQSGVIEKEEVEMVYNVFRLGDMPVKNIMVPRVNIIGFDTTATINDIINGTEKNNHSRFPIYKKTVDNVVGFVHIKDVYQAILHGDGDKKISHTQLIRQIIREPQTRRADDVLLDMQREKIHLAVVHDEKKETVGVVSMEDIVESLVGDIQDEFDVSPRKDIEEIKKGVFRIDARVPIEKIQSMFRVPLKSKGYITIGGLVYGTLGHEPKVGESITINPLTLSVEKIQNNRIKTVLLVVK